MVTELPAGTVKTEIAAVGDSLRQDGVRVAVEQIGQRYGYVVLLGNRVEREVDRVRSRNRRIDVLRPVVDRNRPSVEPDRSAQRVTLGVGGEPTRTLHHHPPHIREEDPWL